MSNYLDYTRPGDQLKLVSAHVGYYGATVTPTLAVFLRTFGTTVDGIEVELSSRHFSNQDQVFAACPTLASNADAILKEFSAFAVAQGLMPAFPQKP